MNISSSITKRDHGEKMDGTALYVADYPTINVLFGKLLRSAKAHAKILDVKVPKLPEMYYFIDKDDVPGINRVHIVEDDITVFAEDTVEYIGDVIGMIVGPNEKEVQQLMDAVIVDYEELMPVVDMRDSKTIFFEYQYGKGNVEQAFEEADKIYEEQFETGYQEQAYLETQGIIAEPHDGRMTVHGSMQCPYYLHGAIAKVLDIEAHQIQVKQDVTGGGFGGKEDFPSILACQVAVAAQKTKQTVRVIFERREDMEFTSKRHPSRCIYKVAVQGGMVTAMDIDVKFNSGAYTTLSPVVLQRGIICASGVYRIENLKVRGQAIKTNTVPTGAYRGFGAPQTFFAVELMMTHIAKDLGVEPLAFKEAHLVKQGDATSTSGKYHFPIPLPEMIEEVDKECDYRIKRHAYNQQLGRYRKGIGMSIHFHGAGFTGSGERDHIKAVTRLHKYVDGRVEILASNTDIGQGLKTTFSKIVAKELQLPIHKVIFENPDTDRVPDSGPTVASRSLMIVGELLRRAAVNLHNHWEEGVEQIVEEHFKEPDFMIPFYLDTFQGDAYPTYSWGVNAVEVELDTLTGSIKILGAYGSYDVGTPIDTNVVLGQMEGGLSQGIAYASIEQMTVDKKGRIRNNSYSDYTVPTAVDIPNIKCKLHVEEYPLGPYGAKGAGELPLISAASAYVAAMEQALGGISIHHIPFTAEDAMKVLREVKSNG